MATNTIILACILMPILLYFESKEIPKGILPVKTVISLLFVMAALLQPRPVPSYFAWILPGLLFCLGGDVFLALPQKKMFFPGLVSFLVGHVFYVICFFYTAPPTGWAIWGAIPVPIVSFLIFLRLKPHLGDMMIPVLAYGTRTGLFGSISGLLRRPLFLHIGPFRGQGPVCEERVHQPHPGPPPLFRRPISSGLFRGVSMRACFDISGV